MLLLAVRIAIRSVPAAVVEGFVAAISALQIQVKRRSQYLEITCIERKENKTRSSENLFDIRIWKLNPSSQIYMILRFTENRTLETKACIQSAAIRLLRVTGSCHMTQSCQFCCLSIRAKHSSIQPTPVALATCELSTNHVLRVGWKIGRHFLTGWQLSSRRLHKGLFNFIFWRAAFMSSCHFLVARFLWHSHQVTTKWIASSRHSFHS